MRKIFLKKLYTFILLLSGIFSFTLKAQIIYTDIPDIQLNCKNSSCWKFDYFDLNNDGTLDFEILVRSSDYSSYCQKCSNHDNGVEAGPVVESNLNFAADYPASQYPSSLVAGIEIGPLFVWIGGFFLRYDYARCDDSYFPTGNCLKGSGGNWTSKKDRYLGLKLISNGQTYYGWARLSVSVSSNAASCTIKDYAYESTPGKSIIAGDTGESSVTKTSNDEVNEEIIDATELKIAPNPVSASTIISFLLPESEKISVRIYDITGRLVKTLIDGKIDKGIHQLTWNTENATAGIYILRLQTSSSVQTRKLVVIK